MPIYEYKCTCKDVIVDILLPMKDYDVPQTCNCGKTLEKVISVPVVVDSTGGKNVSFEDFDTTKVIPGSTNK